MGQVEDAPSAVVELPQEERQPLHEEGDIRRGQDHPLRSMGELRPEALQKLLRSLQVLDHVEQQDEDGAADPEGQRLIEILHEDLHIGVLHSRPMGIDDRHFATLLQQLHRHTTGSGSDVDDGRVLGNGGDRIGVAARVSQLQVVVGRTALRVVAPLVQDLGAMGDVAQRRHHHIERIAHAVHPADLVSIVGGDRPLHDRHPCIEELQDDFGVEVEVVGVQTKRQSGESRHRIESVAAVELR